MFERAYVINLERQPDRFDAQRGRLHELGILDVYRFVATDGSIPTTYSRLAHAGYGELWDNKVLITQDDVGFSSLPYTEGEIVSYGGRSAKNKHLTPWAFSADWKGWENLLEAWGPGVRHICLMWEHLVPIQLELAYHIGPMHEWVESVSGS